MAIEREVDLSQIPKCRKGKGCDWSNSASCRITGVYEEVGFEFIIKSYDKSNQMLKISYNDTDFNIPTKRLIKCQVGKILGKVTSEFKIEMGKRFKDNKRDLIITDRKKVKDENGWNIKYYQYKCNKCGFDGGYHWSLIDKEYKDEFWISEYSLLNGQGCSCCNSNPRIVAKEINSIYKTDPWMIPYIGEEYAKTHTYNNGSEVEVTCPDCGKTKNIYISNLYKRHSIGCICGDKRRYSYGHKYVFNLLTQLNQEFVDNYTFNWCKFYNFFKQKEVSGEYDFVLEDIKTIIEVDGEFHRKDNNMNGQTKDESKWLDNEKDRLAQEHGYNVIRIIYNDNTFNIKQNLIDNYELKDIFDLSKVNWNKCNEFALSNLVKIACDYKKNNPNMTTTQIGKIMNIDKQIILKYLKQGNELGWCEYDAKEEMKKSGKSLSLNNSKPIKIFNKNMDLIYMFSSAVECEKQSYKLFGINFSGTGIYATCTGEQKTHRRHIFKRATKEEYNEWLRQQNNKAI